jgi:hypothetical protein
MTQVDPQPPVARVRFQAGQQTVEPDILIGIMASATRLDLHFRSGSFRLHEFLPLAIYIHVGGNRRRRDLCVDERTKFLAKLRCQQLPSGSKSRAAHLGADARAIAVERGLIQRTGLVLQVRIFSAQEHGTAQ